MAYKVTVNQMRMIEWARNWNWAVTIDWYGNKDSFIHRLIDEFSGSVAIKQLGIVETKGHPFDTWLPATDVTYPLGSVEEKPITAYNAGFSLPLNSLGPKIDVTFVDGGRQAVSPYTPGGIALGYSAELFNHPPTQLLIMHKRLSLWMEDISSPSKGVKTLDKACLPMTIIHYDSIDKLIAKMTYAVYPDGDITFTGGSEGGEQTLQASFIIAGRLPAHQDQLIMFQDV